MNKDEKESTNILFVTHYAELYGANRSLLNLIDGLKCFPVNCFVLIPEKGLLEQVLEKQNIPFRYTFFYRWIYKRSVQRRKSFFKNILLSLLRLYKNNEIANGLVSKIKRLNIQIVYSNTAVTPFGALLAIKLKVPHIWHLREFGDMDFGLTWDLNHKIIRYLIGKYSRAVICISKSIHNHYVTKRFKDKYYIFHDGLFKLKELEKIKEKWEQKNRTSVYFTFAIIGSVQEAKGQQQAIKVLFELCKSYDHIRLNVIGSGDIHNLKQLTKKYNLVDKVLFFGYLNDLDEIYNHCDAILMCSRYEALGRVTIEAMAYGKPVIGFNKAGTSELIQDGCTGLLYNNDEELVTQMRKLLWDKEFYNHLRNNGYYYVKDNFLIDNYAKEIYEIIENCLSRS